MAFSTDGARPPCRPPCTAGYHLQARERPRGSLDLAGRPHARREELLAMAAKTGTNVWAVAMGRLQPSGTRGAAAAGLLLGETLGHRRGQRARACSARRLHRIGPYHTLTPDGQASPPTGRQWGERRRGTRRRRLSPPEHTGSGRGRRYPRRGPAEDHAQAAWRARAGALGGTHAKGPAGLSPASCLPPTTSRKPCRAHGCIRLRTDGRCGATPGQQCSGLCTLCNPCALRTGVESIVVGSIILRTITECGRNGVLCCRPLHNRLHAGYSAVSRSLRRSLAILDSGGLDKHL